MITKPVTIKPGAFIVFEGLDATGKSTQLKMFHEAYVDRIISNDEMLFTHQPSGGSAVGNAVYAVTEDGDIASPLARQLLHLASHAEHYEREILPHLTLGNTVLMDRCWWSTIAYGYFGGSLHSQIPYNLFETIAKLPTKGCSPDVVFLFTEPHQEDRHNTPDVRHGYEVLAERFSDTVVRVPAADEDNTFLNILLALHSRGLAE